MPMLMKHNNIIKIAHSVKSFGCDLRTRSRRAGKENPTEKNFTLILRDCCLQFFILTNQAV
jgi:hypothetical protein